METRFAVVAGGLSLVLSLGGQALAAGTGAASSSSRAAHPTFANLDVDGDGVLTCVEAADVKDLVDNWYQADRNGDGVVERSEFAAFEASGAMGPAAPPTSLAALPKPVSRRIHH